jgi:hypothetical protein
MPRALPKSPGDPFDGLRLPMSAWKAVEAAQITGLEQLMSLAPTLNQVPNLDAETAQIIQDRLNRLTSRRSVRVRLMFPKHSPRKDICTRG